MSGGRGRPITLGSATGSGRQYRHSQKTLERFRKAWIDGVPTWALAERFGIGTANVHGLAMRLGLTKRGADTLWN